jgi:hypothetical protein
MVEDKVSTKVRSRICRPRQNYQASRTRSGEFSADPALAKQVTAKNSRRSPSVCPDPIPTSRKEIESPENRLPKVQIAFAELENGSLVETVEDPTDPNRTLFAIFRRGRVRLVEDVEDRERILVPITRSTLGFAEVKLPRGVMPYRSVKRLMDTLPSFIRSVVDVPDRYAELLSAFVLYTWIADRLPTAVYLSIIGLPQSGKSTLLELLSLLCRRALLVNDISQAAAYQACTNFGPTLLIDEIDWRSSGTASNFRQLLRSGISHSSRALRVRQSSCSFGPKVFGSLEASSDSALNSRCIQLIMAETDKRGLLKPGHPSVVKFANDLQQQLLRFRFNSYNLIAPAKVRGAEDLRPRSRDILSSLAAPLVRSQLWIQILFEFLKRNHDPVTPESLEPRQEALNAAIWTIVHCNGSLQNIRFGGELGLRKWTNHLLLNGGERLSVTEKEVGRMLASLGYRSTQRTKVGWILWLNTSTVARCHQLFKTYDNKHIRSSASAAPYITSCPKCRAFATPTRTFLPRATH